jgi:hypothetical protein
MLAANCREHCRARRSETPPYKRLREQFEPDGREEVSLLGLAVYTTFESEDGGFYDARAMVDMLAEEDNILFDFEDTGIDVEVRNALGCVAPSLPGIRRPLLRVRLALSRVDFTLRAID